MAPTEKGETTDEARDLVNSIDRVVKQIKLLETSILEVSNESERELEVSESEKDTESSIQAVSQLRTVLQQAAESIDKEATKIAFGIKAVNDLSGLESLLQSFFKPLEVLLSTGFVLGNHNFLCKAAKDRTLQVLSVVAKHSQDLLESFRALKGKTPSKKEFSIVVLKTAVLQEKCKLIRTIPSSNASAVKRRVLEVAVECKDSYEEFKELAENVNTETEKSTKKMENDEGTSAKAAMGSDEWYAEMDDFVSSLTPDEASLVEKYNKLFYAVYASLRCMSNIIGCSMDSNEVSKEEEYLKWLDSCTSSLALVQEEIGTLGMSLYPKHVMGEIESHATKLRSALLEMGKLVRSWNGEMRNGEDICFKRIEQLLGDVEEMTVN
mmetsp:Transcript_9772/g.11752  ORF Transcript_9772/g.11752 Transcript_9772/m.11752 type:complete len:381 (-) Transcript_9772:1453-2595(-)